MSRPGTSQVTDVTLVGAQAAVQGALGRAQALGVAVTIAVVDRAGHLIALARQETANLVSLDLAIGKAYSALVMQTPTRDLGALVQPQQPLYHLDLAHHGRPLVTFAGGIPWGEPAVGAIGVSGGSPEQDDEIAAAGISAVC